VITIKENDGSPKDLTDYVAESQMRRSYTSTSYVEIDANITNPSSGEISLSMPSATTSILKPGRYVYDMKITNSADVVTRVIEGILTVSPCVTRIDEV
jgi:hypothetical protein